MFEQIKKYCAAAKDAKTIEEATEILLTEYNKLREEHRHAGGR